MTKEIRKHHQARMTLLRQNEPAFATDMHSIMLTAEDILKANRRKLVAGEINIHEFRQRQGKVHKAVAIRNDALFRAYFGEYQ